MKEIKGYEGLYKIDEFGNVYSLPRLIERPQGNYYTKTKKIKPQKSYDGYIYVGLYKNKKQKKHYIHRLVAKTFLKGEKETVDHLDFNKENNHYSNLEWCDRQENYQRYIKLGKHYSEGVIVLNKINGVFHKSISEASRCYNVSRKCLEYRLKNNLSNKLILTYE